MPPLDLDNILVVGKAYSVSHDAMALARMQRDMMALGGAAGLIAARSAEDDTPLAEVDIRRMQQGLVELGVLSQQDLHTITGVSDHALPPMSKDELRRLIGRLAAGELKLDGQVSILARPKAAIPLLKEALAQADGKAKVELARALCFLSDPSGSQTLLDELTRLLAGKQPLPGITRVKRLAHPLPDHGFAPDATYLINTLARMGDKRIIPFMTNIAGRVHRSKRTSGFFSYVFSICYAAERLADPACLEALEILAARRGLHGLLLARGSDLRRNAESKPPWPDRIAYLEFCIGRAQARCGSRAGYDKLLEALGDIRGFIARSAHDELVALTGRELGYDANAWRASLRSVKIVPKPYRHDAPAAKGQ